MIHYLLLYQFVFIYCIITLIGLIVYGSDFDTIASWLYIGPVVIIPLTHKWISRAINRALSPIVNYTVLALAATMGMVIYGDLHFSFWDERSLSQAIAISLLGIFSYVASLIAAQRVKHWQGNHILAAISAFLAIACVWMLTRAYPMLPIMAVSIISAVALLWPVKSFTGATTVQSSRWLFQFVHPGYLMFLIVMDLAMVVWDYQVNTQWGVHLGLAFFSGALGHYLRARNSAINTGIIVISIVNLCVTIIWPLWLLQYSHAVIAGLGIGMLSRHYMFAHRGEFEPLSFLKTANPVVWALIFAYIFYANLDYVQWRGILVVPFLVLMAIRVRSGKQA